MIVICKNKKKIVESGSHLLFGAYPRQKKASVSFQMKWLGSVFVYLYSFHSILKSCYHVKTLFPPFILSLLPSLPLSHPFCCSFFLTNPFSTPMSCSFHQKKGMFLPRRTPFSAHHTPVRSQACLTKPSSGPTWLWLVATTDWFLIKVLLQIYWIACLVYVESQCAHMNTLL